MYEFLYLKITLVGLALCLLCYFLAKRQRKEILLMGTIGAVAANLQSLWFGDYWHPDYMSRWPHLEEAFFGFAALGLISIICEALLKKREVIAYQPHPIVFWSLVLLFIFGPLVFAPILNSIYAASLVFIIVWIIIVSLRHDLVGYSLGSGLITLAFVFLSYQIILAYYPSIINRWWSLENISGFFLASVPIEEYLWFFFAGIAIAPLYELSKGLTFRK